MIIAAEGNAKTASAQAVPWRAGLATAGTSVMFGFMPLAARALCRWFVDLVATVLAVPVCAGNNLAGIRLAGLRLRAAMRQGAWQIALVGVSLGRYRPSGISRVCAGSTRVSRCCCSIPSRR